MRVDDSLGEGQVRHPNVVEALGKLRDSLINDALAIKNKYSDHE